MLARAQLLVVAAICAGCAHHLVRRPDVAPAATLIRDVAVLEVDTGVRIEHQDVLLQAGKIARVAATGLEAPAGAEIIDGRGATLLPGLIDMHSHTGEAQGPPWDLKLPDREHNYECQLYAGVTSLLDPGDIDDDAFSERAAVASGKTLGPHLYIAGPIFTAPEGHPVALIRAIAPAILRSYVLRHQTREIASVADAEPMVAALAGSKPDFVKLVVDAIPAGVPKLDDARAKAIVDAASKHGVRAVAHIGSTDDAVVAARAGVAAWVHGVYTERIPDERIAELAAFHIPMVSTVAVFDAVSRFGEPRQSTALEHEIATTEQLSAFDHAPAPGENAAVDVLRPWVEMLRGHRQDWIDNLRRLHQAGVEILAGTDSAGVFPGAGLHRELQFLVDAGFTPAEAIRAATIAPAKFLTRSETPPFGRVVQGLRADLLLVNGDPTAELTSLSSIRAVFLDGVQLSRTPVAQ